MKKYLKIFFQRGLIFGSFGPIIASIVYLCLSLSIEDFTLSGSEVFLGVISTYILAFVQAGASIFNQIEGWPIAKSLLIHLSVLYFTYILCYLINTWLPFEWTAVLIFTAIFLLVYFVVWLTVFITVSITSKKLNRKLM